VTLVSILVFCASTTISSGVYRGATVAMILAVLGAVVRAVALTHVAEPRYEALFPPHLLRRGTRSRSASWRSSGWPPLALRPVQQRGARRCARSARSVTSHGVRRLSRT